MAEIKYLEINDVTRMINVPANLLLGVIQDKNVERLYFRCKKIVGDNIDLSKHQIYINYINALDKTGERLEIKEPGTYHCEDVTSNGDYITFSWLLSENVFKKRGFLAFSVNASDGEKTRWNTFPAIGTVLITITGGLQEASERYPDIITQLLNRMNKVEELATPEAMQGYVNTYLAEHPAEIDPELLDPKKCAPADVVGQLKEDKVDKLGVSQVSKVNTDFITSDMLVDIPQKKWKNEQQSSYHYESIVKNDISFKGSDVRIFIGSSTNPDRNVIAIVNMHEKGKEDYTVSTTLTESDLNKWSGALTSNTSIFDKLEIRLYSSFSSVLEPNTETIINDIKVTTTGREGKYKLNGVFIDKDAIVDNAPDTTIITVKSDGTGDYTNPVKATNDIFNRAYNGEKFIIQIYEGTYDIYASWEDVNRNGWYITGANIGWNIHANIKLVGIGDRDKIICNCFLPDDSDPELVIKSSCINANFGAYMENITFVAKNTRYCCHADNANYYKNLSYDIKNCVFKHIGNKDGFWAYHGGWVEGSSSGNTYKFEDCEFVGVLRGYGTHTNNQQGGFTIPCLHKFINCKFINKGSAVQSISFECMGSGVLNRVYINGCYIETGLKMGQNPSDAEIDIEIMMSGCSNIPIEKTSAEMKIYVL